MTVSLGGLGVGACRDYVTTDDKPREIINLKRKYFRFDPVSDSVNPLSKENSMFFFIPL